MPVSLARSASANPSPSYERHQTEHTLLYQLVEQHYPIFKASLEDQRQSLPHHIQQQFDDFLKYSRLEYGFLWLRCEDCHHERLVAFSCKRRGFCPGCGARRMAESAALSVDAIFPEAPIRQWVLRFPFQRYRSFPNVIDFMFARAIASGFQRIGFSRLQALAPRSDWPDAD